MDNRIKELDRTGRVALARIIYDLIVADRIIDDEEVAKFEQLFGGESNRQLFYNAQKLSFADASKQLICLDDEYVTGTSCLLLSSQRRKQAELAIQLLDETVKSDGFCAPSEAVLQLAIDCYLKRNDETYTKYDIQSFQLTDIFIGKRFVLYAETGASSINIEIVKNYDLIENLLSGIGFQFIYIPRIVEQYKNKGLSLFKALSTYIFPDIPEDRIVEVYEKIRTVRLKSQVRLPS